jgi:fermentation-respiration switch protein FrsA (DUF1100 family)
MKITATFFVFILSSLTLFAQDITGDWNGALQVQGIQLRLVFHISKSDTGLTATMDSPDQGVKGIPVPTTTFIDGHLHIELSAARIVYNGSLNGNTIEGIFQQGGTEFPMNLSHETIGVQTFNRPQEPKEPYPYYTENVTFTNTKDAISLAGTLTLPKKEGVFPVVVLITGSGPQDRNEELLGHKPFLVLADYLTKNGIAVLRCDDRGVGQSKGDFGKATTADFATDVESAVAYLKTRKEINSKKIGLVGHSEGGVIAPIVANRSKDVAFIVLLAGTGIQGDQLLLLQQELIAKVEGATPTELKDSRTMNSYCFNKVLKSKDDIALKGELTTYLTGILKDTPKTQKPEGITDEENVAKQVAQLCSPWMLYFLRYNPATALSKVTCPVLAINGDKDLQVPAKENIEAIAKVLDKSGNKRVTTKIFPGLNHLFQECKTGSPSEYTTIEETLSPAVLAFVTEWIVKTTK